MPDRQIAAAFDEPDCAVNRAKPAAERQLGCAAAALAPGAAAGGCAFDGAKIALQPITDAAHLVHGPIACDGNSWDSRNTGSSGPQLYRTGFTTDLSEIDIIQGGERRLARALRQVAESHRPAAIFVYVTCVPALIGDDVAAVCEAAADQLGLPVIPVDVPGFVGSKNLGNKLAGRVLLDRVVGTREPADPSPTDINLIGEYNVAGELWQVRPLLDRLGVRVRAAITGDARYHDVATAHRARLSMVVCSKAMVAFARGLHDRYGIPYFEGSFYGIGETSAALRQIALGLAAAGGPADLPARAEALIAEAEAQARARLSPYRARLTGRRVLLYTGGVKSWSVVAALQEMGLTVVGTSVRKSTEEDKDRARALLGDDAALFGQIPARELYGRLAAGEADLLMSGGRTQFVALKTRTPWLDINQERHHAYAGYDGAVALAAEVDAALHHPVWHQVRRPAPWDGAGASACR